MTTFDDKEPVFVSMPSPGAFAHDRLIQLGDLFPGGIGENGFLRCPQGREMRVKGIGLAAAACTETQ